MNLLSIVLLSTAVVLGQEDNLAVDDTEEVLAARNNVEVVAARNNVEVVAARNNVDVVVDTDGTGTAQAVDVQSQQLNLVRPTEAPYINNYQVTHQPHAQQFPLDILTGSQQQYGNRNPGYNSYNYNNNQNRPTLPELNQLAAQAGHSVTTPEELLDMCCQFPACYDPLYELCIDTCRKCETVYPVTSWLPCPPLLNIPDCTSPTLSYMGKLPLACYPDIGPFGNILPLSSILDASRLYQGNGKGGNEGLDQGQVYRANMREGNRKQCTRSGICSSDRGDSNRFGRPSY